MIKYVFLDDENEEKAEGFTHFFRSKSDEIMVAHTQPLKDWKHQLNSFKRLLTTSKKQKHTSKNVNEQIDHIRGELNLSDGETPDGIILDLRLDENLDTGYKGNSIAQELRNLATENLIKDCPLILFSGGNNLKAIFSPDSTSHDLFDAKFEKEQMDGVLASQARKQLSSLSKGYKLLEENENICDLLGVEKEADIEYRIFDFLKSLQHRNAPPHEFARFILRKIIGMPGVLIDEYLLAARLGVDIKKTKEKSWEKLKESLTEYRYFGVFNEAWERWWMDRLNIWWEKTIDADTTITELESEEKIIKINKKLGIKLVLAKKTKMSRSSDFWIICKETKRPISLDDGILASSDFARVPWQEDEYYSIDVAIKKDDTEIHPVDRERLKKLKKILTKTRKNG